MKSVAVTREEKGKRVSDSSETLMAMDRQEKLITAFQDWVWKDEERKRRLEHIYDSRYACRRQRPANKRILSYFNMLFKTRKRLNRQCKTDRRQARPFRVQRPGRCLLPG